MKNKKIQILMATYNGEKYLEEQLDSILNQTHTNWELLIRDDGSKDKTLEIIKKYTSKYTHKIFFINDNLGNLGLCYNFLRLLDISSSEYIMFSDQDDIWLENKIKTTLSKMIDEEAISPNIPLLVHTDLKVINKDKYTLYDSFYDFNNINPNKIQFINYLLLRSCVTGCTIMMNKKLRDIIIPYPSMGIIVHDYWISLIASIFGKISYINDKTILYRIHDNNSIGIKAQENIKKSTYEKNRFTYILKFKEKKNKFLESCQNQPDMANLILANYNNLPKDKKKLINAFATLFEDSFISKRLNIIFYRFWEPDLIKNLRRFIYL